MTRRHNQPLAYPGVVSFDFDDTLMEAHTGHPILPLVHLARRYLAAGYDLHIVTARCEHEGKRALWGLDWGPSLEEWCWRWRLTPVQIHYTCRERKSKILQEIGAEVHYDDDLYMLEDIERHGLNGVNMLHVLECPEAFGV